MLTDRSIRYAKPKASVYRLRDDNIVCRGFGVVVAPEGKKGRKGTKTFFLSYTSPEDGKRKQISLGRYPNLSLAEARKKAAQVREEVDAGRDPALEKRVRVPKRRKPRWVTAVKNYLRGTVNGPDNSRF